MTRIICSPRPQPEVRGNALRAGAERLMLNSEAKGKHCEPAGRWSVPSGLESVPLGHGSARTSHHVFPVLYLCWAALP